MPRRLVVVTALSSLLLATTLVAAAAPSIPDLNTWTQYSLPHAGIGSPGDGQWVVGPTGTDVDQVINGKPTWFVSPDDAVGYRITATITTTATDDDFVGFALGFSDDPALPSADYVLIDWRQGSQTIDWSGVDGDVTGVPGLAVSRVTGVPNLNELWAHVDLPVNPGGGVTELARGATLGAIGWADSTSYDFVIEYRADSLDVWVDGSHELSVVEPMPSGPFALYDFSQEGVSFSGITFEMINEPPVIDGSGASDISVSEGSIGSTSGSFTDPNGDDLTLSCSGPCVGFVDESGGAWSWSQVLPEGPDGFDVSITATDGEFEVTDVFSVSVANVAPVITTASGLPSAHPEGDLLDVDFEFTDAGVLDTHTATINWGDGSSTPASVVQGSGSGSGSAVHVYSEPGVYEIRLTVVDDDGGSDKELLGTVTVFDPNDFVTGGGWYVSPSGAVLDEPGHSGKGTFGFVVRYRSDGSVSGNLQLQVHKELKLHATSFDSLVILDGVAEFSGSARVNGASGYQFEVVAIDQRLAGGDVDRFWVEIRNGSGLIYGGPAYPSPLPIKGKGIQVHDK